MQVIYRKSDRWIAGWVQPPHSVDVEIANICASELGGVPADYGVVEFVGVKPRGTHFDVAPNLAVTTMSYPVSSGRDFLRNGVVPNITGAGSAAKLDRIAALCVLDPAFAMVINVCNIYETLTGGDVTFLRKLWGRKLAVGGLSAGEVTAIEAAAPTYGITLP